jgi:hypothetical protein
MEDSAMKKLISSILAAFAFALTAITAPAQDGRYLFHIAGQTVIISDVSTHQLIARTTMATLQRDGHCLEVRHLALNSVAAVVAGDGAREKTVNPDVTVNTLEERDQTGVIPVVTIEHGKVFVIHHDSTNPDGSYSAVIWMLKGPIKPVRPSDPEREQRQLKERHAPLAPVLAA